MGVLRSLAELVVALLLGVLGLLRGLVESFGRLVKRLV